MFRPKAQMALVNIGLYQYLMSKDIRKKNQIFFDPERDLWAVSFLLPGTQMVLKILAYLSFSATKKSYDDSNIGNIVTSSYNFADQDVMHS